MSNPSLSLDPTTTALVLIDLQHGIVAMDVHPQPSSAVVAQAKKMADAFRAAHAPVVWVTVGTLGVQDALAPLADAMPPPAARLGSSCT